MIMQCRPYGLDHGICAWCSGEEDLRTNFAAFVSEENSSHAVEFFKENGLQVRVDNSRAREGRFQVKIMACDNHIANLRLLRELTVVNNSTVTEKIIKFTII